MKSIGGRPTIKGLDTAQVHLPAHMLAVDLTHIRHIESILLTRTTVVHIHLRRTLLQHLQNQILGSQRALRQGVLAMTADQTKMIHTIGIVFFEAYFSSRYTRSRCHNHAAATQHNCVK